MSLPSSLSYAVSRISPMKRTAIRMTPQGSRSASYGQQITVEFGAGGDAIYDLTTLRMECDFVLTTAVDASAGIWIPDALQTFRRAEFLVGGQSVCGQNNTHFDQVMTAFHRLNGSEAYEKSKLESYRLIQAPNANGQVASPFNASTTKRRFIVDVFGGLQTSRNAASFDTSIFPNLELRLQLNDLKNMVGYAASGITNTYDWQLQNIQFVCDTLSFVNPAESQMYDAIVSEMLSQGMPIQTSYDDVVSQIQKSNASLRFNVSSASVEELLWMPLLTDYATPQTATADQTNQTAVAAAADIYGARAYRFRLRDSAAAVPDYDEANPSVTWFWRINGANYPTYSASAQQGIEGSVNLYMGQDLSERNLLFRGTYDETGSRALGRHFSKLNALDSNCIVAVDLRSEDAGSGALSGLNTSSGTSAIELQLNGHEADDYVLLVAKTKTVLSASSDGGISVQY